MPSIIINGILGLNGEYPIDLDFTMRDFRTIKQVAGVRPGELTEAIGAGDTDLIIALTAIALRRAGKAFDEDVLLDSTPGQIVFDASDLEEVEDDSPPPDAGDGRSDSGRPTSGTAGSGPTASSPETSTPPASGTPQQVSGSARLTSTT